MGKRLSSKIWIRLAIVLVLAVLVVLGSMFFGDHAGETDPDIPMPYSTGPSGPPSSNGPLAPPSAY